MYRPPPNRVEEPETAVEMLRRHGFGHLVAVGADGIDAAALPFLVDGSDSPGMRIRAHVARANPIWRAAPCPALLIVCPADAYVSPGWYPSKATDPRVVPTWNYELVHVHGTLHARPERDFLAGVVGELTAREEGSMAAPWSVADAPEEFIDRMLRAIVGVELEIARIEAKRKLSQNRSPADVAGVVAGLAAGDGRSIAVAGAMADVTGTDTA